MNKIYKIEWEADEQVHVFLPKELSNETVDQVTFGSTCLQANIHSRNDNKKIITLSKSLAQNLMLPTNYNNIRLHAFVKDHTLFLGPILGVFTAGFTSIPVHPIGARTKFFADVCKIAWKEGIFPIIFGLQHIQWTNGSIHGFTFHEGRWEKIEVPFPNVIYDRLPNRKVENLEQIQNMKKRLEQEYLIPWYNPGFFDKLHIYNKLKISERTSIFLPKTVPFESVKHLQKMLDEFSSVYIKSKSGSLGKGIYQVIKNKSNEYYCRFRDEDEKNRLIKFTSLYSFVQHKFPKNKHKNYIIQQAIPLLKSNGKKADFRVHTNKGIDGKWYVTAIGGKIVRETTATTHIASGGMVQTLEEMFPNSEIRLDTKKKLVQAALTLSQELDEQIQGNIAEIGFDLGIDEKGKVWMFEANSKPGRSIFSHPDLKKIENIPLKMAIVYSTKLMKESIEKIGEPSNVSLLQ